MFGDNSGIDLKITEDNSYNFTLEISVFRDGYIFVTLGLILIVTMYFSDPVKALTTQELLSKFFVFKAAGLLLIIYALINNFKKYRFDFSVVEQECEICERHLFFLKKKYKVKVGDIKFSLNIINGEGPNRYQATLIVNDEKHYPLGDSASSEDFEPYMLRLQDIGVDCFGI